ncbi:glycoside hydrolase family 3 protein, partial [bacterium]
IPKLGLPKMRMSDGPVGVRNFGPTTAYPATLALAASFSPELGRRYGEAIGRDARARGVYIQLAPAVNLARVPQNGRNFEYLGEDPLVAARMAVGYIQGVQSQGVSATVKHYVGNEHENDRNKDSSEIADRPLRELYLRPFEAAVSEGRVQCVMSSYNLFRGTYTTANAPLVQGILKGEWGFAGIYMSDWGAAHETLGTVRNGLDLEMPGPEFMNAAAIMPLLKSGQVTEAMIDDKVRRILRVAYTMGWDAGPQEDPTIGKPDPANEATALDVARQGTVLLKNVGATLPLGPNTRRILVIGPNATPAVTGGGGSSYTDPTKPLSLAEAITKAAPAGTQVTVKRGVPDVTDAFAKT